VYREEDEEEEDWVYVGRIKKPCGLKKKKGLVTTRDGSYLAPPLCLTSWRGPGRFEET
jgi:hypothetical protein